MGFRSTGSTTVPTATNRSHSPRRSRTLRKRRPAVRDRSALTRSLRRRDLKAFITTTRGRSSAPSMAGILRSVEAHTDRFTDHRMAQFALVAAHSPLPSDSSVEAPGLNGPRLHAIRLANVYVQKVVRQSLKLRKSRGGAQETKLQLVPFRQNFQCQQAQPLEAGS